MNSYLLAAAGLAFLVGLAHSVLGEVLVFAHLRQGEFVPTHGGPNLRPRHVRILWASWHLVTLFGWCLAAMLLVLARPSSGGAERAYLLQAVAGTMVCGAGLVLVGTRGRHPGWVGLLAVSLLIALGS